MPELGINRELSVGEVNQIQSRRNIIIISVLALVFIGAFFFSLRDLSPTYTMGIVFLLFFFLLSFINIRIGFVLVVLAFLFSPEVNFSGTTVRGVTIRFEDLLLIVIMLAWLGRLAMGLQKHLMIYTPLNLPIGLIVLWNIICSLRAITGGMVETNICIFTNLKIIEFFLVYFLIINNLNSLKEAKFMFYILLLAALVVGIYTSIQIPKTQMFTTSRLTAPFEGKPEPTTLGGYLAIFFGLALSIFLYADKSALKRLSAVLLVLLPLPIMFSFSRSAYFATLVIIFSLAIISKKKWLITLIILFLLLSPFILPKPVIDRALYNFKDARFFGFVDPSTAERVLVYQKAWNYIRTYPVFGAGIATGGGIIDSQYARIMIETSIIGFVLFLWLIVRLIKTGISLFRRSREGWIKGVAIGFVVVVLGLCIHCWGAITFYIVRIAEPFWALAALIAYMQYYINTQKDKPVLSAAK